MTELSPFAEVAPRLVAMGHSPIVIAPGHKVPGRLSSAGHWEFMVGWQQRCRSQLTLRMMELWATWPDAGVGVACGFGGLIAIDIDDESCLQSIIDLLPPSRVAKRGKKGLTLFYRGDSSKIPSRNYRASDGRGLVDLLADGKQTVLPPTIHPDTGAPYYWATDDTLEDTRIEDLPLLPDDIAERIGEALREFGYDPESKPAPSPPVAAASAGGGGGSGSVYRDINDLARANLHAWVPDLELPKCRYEGSRYVAVAWWRPSSRGRPLEKRSPNLSISSDHGIVDFGDSGKSKGGFKSYSPIDLVMVARRCSLDEAFAWLGERVDPHWNDPPLIILNSKGRG
jgi:hypothetical protein